MLNVVVRRAIDEVDTVKNCEMPDICLQHLVALIFWTKPFTFASIHDKARIEEPAVLRQRAKVELVANPGIDARRACIPGSYAEAQRPDVHARSPGSTL